MANIVLSAQNFDIYDGDGLDPFARTGAVSVDMLYRVGAKGVILGHSETNDSVTVVRNKLLTIVKRQKEYKDQNLLIKTTILVGETWDEFEKNSMAAVSEIVSKRLEEIIKDLPIHFLQNLTIGYEPKWGSRGSGNDAAPPPQPALISVCIKEMGEVIRKYHGDKASDSIAMIYGGRSTPERTREILKDINVEGLILGSACNTLQKTLDIIQAMQKTMGNRKKILHANFKAYNLPGSYQDYINVFQKLDDGFTIFISPSYTDLKEIKNLL